MAKETKKDKIDDTNVVAIVSQRASDLYSLKAPRYQKVLDIKAEYKQYNIEGKDKDNQDYTKYSMNT